MSKIIPKIFETTANVMFRGRIGNWSWLFESLKTRFIKRGFSEMIARNKNVRRRHAKIEFSYFSADLDMLQAFKNLLWFKITGISPLIRQIM